MTKENTYGTLGLWICGMRLGLQGPALQQDLTRMRAHAMIPRSVGSISRGDVAALLVSAMSEPNCVNTEIIAGRGTPMHMAREAAHGELNPSCGPGLTSLKSRGLFGHGGHDHLQPAMWFAVIKHGD